MDRHSQAADEREHMLPGRATEDAVLVLQRYDVDVADVEILRRPPVGRQAVVAKGEANFGGVLAGRIRFHHRHDQTLGTGEFRGNGVSQVAGVGGDPAAAGRIGADEGDPVEGHGRTCWRDRHGRHHGLRAEQPTAPVPAGCER